MNHSGPVSGRQLRLDVQGLRTLAVGLVIVYHLFPRWLPGGFIGVDIFLVISGFLIVGSLVREASSTGRIRLSTFYARRIRRLLPASTLVLLAVMAATVLVLPQSRWQDVSRDVVASALQVQNWNQAFGSTSYESAGALVSPVQHFWSLAVEEQFYLVIPLLIVFAVACGRLLRLDAKTAGLWFLTILVLASFIHSVVFSTSDHDIAYFATTTRMWELALGGIAAMVLGSVRIGFKSRILAGWLGLGLVIGSAFIFETSMAFPGYIALAPVAGTLLLIAAGAPAQSGHNPGPASVSHYLALRPVTFLGDISYSLYLWHWPVIVFYVILSGHEPGLLGGVGILALSLILAIASYFLVEQRFRSGKARGELGGRRFTPRVRNRGAYALAGSLVVLSCFAAAGPWSIVQIKSLQMQSATQAASLDYPGALAFAAQNAAKVPENVPVSPDPAVATKDVPVTNKDDCGVYDPATIADSHCDYGDLVGSRTLVVVGDSHAGQYVDPLASIASNAGWRVGQWCAMVVHSPPRPQPAPPRPTQIAQTKMECP